MILHWKIVSATNDHSFALTKLRQARIIVADLKLFWLRNPKNRDPDMGYYREVDLCCEMDLLDNVCKRHVVDGVCKIDPEQYLEDLKAKWLALEKRFFDASTEHKEAVSRVSDRRNDVKKIEAKRVALIDAYNEEVDKEAAAAAGAAGAGAR